MLQRLLPLYRRFVPATLREPISRALNWPQGSIVSYSAHGEDLFVRSWLDELGVERTSIKYLDIGANHPSILSNTYLFYKMGASGVMVEPTPNEADLIAKHRPRDVLIRAGIAFDDRLSATLFQFDPSVYNTFDPSEANENYKNIKALGHPIKRVGEIEVQLMEMTELISTHFNREECHFLSLDVEGVDSKILRSVDWNMFRPWFICCERPEADVSEQLLEAGYSLRAQVPHNAIFVRNDVVTRRI